MSSLCSTRTAATCLRSSASISRSKSSSNASDGDRAPCASGFAADAFASRGAATRASTSSLVSSHQGSRRNASSSATGSEFASARLLARDASSFSRAAIAEAVAVCRREDAEASASSAGGTSSRPEPPPKQHERHPPLGFAATPMPRARGASRTARPPGSAKKQVSARRSFSRKVSPFRFERQLVQIARARAAPAAGCRVRTTTKSSSSGRPAMAARWRATRGTRSACDTTRRTAPRSRRKRPREPNSGQIRRRRATLRPCSACSGPRTRTTRRASACRTSSEAPWFGRWCPTSRSSSTSCRTTRPSCSPSLACTGCTARTTFQTGSKRTARTKPKPASGRRSSLLCRSGARTTPSFSCWSSQKGAASSCTPPTCASGTCP